MTVKCTWDGCCSTFKTNSSLKRHIKTVHQRIRSYECPVTECDAAFAHAFDLKRHELSVHIKERNAKCSHCSKAFSSKYTLSRHEQAVHSAENEKPSFLCAHCGFRFRRKDHLASHINIKHSEFEYFKCHDCGCRFSHKSYLRKHIIIKHIQQDNTEPVEKGHSRCVECKRPFQFKYQLLDHYVEVHNVDLKTQQLSFSSYQEFSTWKRKLEDSTVTRFRIVRRAPKKRIYVCHRSGNYDIKSTDRKRAPLLRGSKKINGLCPASILLQINSDDTCVATFTQTHLGHSINDRDEIKYTFLHKEDRERLGAFLTAGVPKRRILDDQSKGSDTLLCDFMNANVTRTDLLSNKDLWNIESSFKVKPSESKVKPQLDDIKNMDAFINEFKDSILFYKRQGESSPKKFHDCHLKNDDVVLVFMCPSQEKMLKKHGRSVVCLDSTDNVNSCEFILHSLIVMDHDGEGFPAAFAFSNRDDKGMIKIFLRCIKEKLSQVVVPHTLMSDMEEAHYDAWIEEMGEPEVHLPCMWYIWQAWKKHLPKVNKKMKQDLYDLSVETSVDTFHEKLDAFLTIDSKANDFDTKTIDFHRKTNDFLKYFRREFCNDNQWLCWSYAYRLHAGINTNTHLEGFHRTLKYLHGVGKTLKDLYSGLRQMVTYIKQEMSTMLGKAIGGKITPRLTALRQAHKQVEVKGVISIQKIDEGWLVPSFQEAKDGCEEMYIIRKIRDKCPAIEDEDIRACHLICSECNECAHKYSCTCIESGIRSLMCKHIHAVVLFERASPSQTEDCSSVEFEKSPVWSIYDDSFISSSSESVPVKVELHTPVSSKVVFQEIISVLDQKMVDVEQCRQNLWKRFTNIIEKLDTKDEFDIVMEYLSQMESALQISNNGRI